MVEQRIDALSAVFRALGDPTRRQMLRRLTKGELSVGELGAPFNMSLAATSKHVKVLERAGLLRRTVQGRTHLCRLEVERLADAEAWLNYYQGFWHKQLDALDALLGHRATPDDRRPKSEERP